MISGGTFLGTLAFELRAFSLLLISSLIVGILIGFKSFILLFIETFVAFSLRISELDHRGDATVSLDLHLKWPRIERMSVIDNQVYPFSSLMNSKLGVFCFSIDFSL